MVSSHMFSDWVQTCFRNLNSPMMYSHACSSSRHVLIFFHWLSGNICIRPLQQPRENFRNLHHTQNQLLQSCPSIQAVKQAQVNSINKSTVYHQNLRPPSLYWFSQFRSYLATLVWQYVNARHTLTWLASKCFDKAPKKTAIPRWADSPEARSATKRHLLALWHW